MAREGSTSDERNDNELVGAKVHGEKAENHDLTLSSHVFLSKTRKHGEGENYIVKSQYKEEGSNKSEEKTTDEAKATRKTRVYRQDAYSGKDPE